MRVWWLLALVVWLAGCSVADVTGPSLREWASARPEVATVGGYGDDVTVELRAGAGNDERRSLVAAYGTLLSGRTRTQDWNLTITDGDSSLRLCNQPAANQVSSDLYTSLRADPRIGSVEVRTRFEYNRVFRSVDAKVSGVANVLDVFESLTPADVVTRGTGESDGAIAVSDPATEARLWWDRTPDVEHGLARVRLARSVMKVADVVWVGGGGNYEIRLARRADLPKVVSEVDWNTDCDSCLLTAENLSVFPQAGPANAIAGMKLADLPGATGVSVSRVGASLGLDEVSADAALARIAADPSLPSLSISIQRAGQVIASFGGSPGAMVSTYGRTAAARRTPSVTSIDLSPSGPQVVAAVVNCATAPECQAAARSIRAAGWDGRGIVRITGKAFGDRLAVTLEGTADGRAELKSETVPYGAPSWTPSPTGLAFFDAWQTTAS